MPVGIEILPLFLTGLLTGIGHCVGMCGPIFATFAIYQKQSKHVDLSPALTIYHTGRMIGLMMLGAILGLVGLLASHLLPNIQNIQAGLTLVGGILVFAFGLGLIGLLPTQRWIEQKGPGQLVVRYIRHVVKQKRGYETAMQLGIANGLLPCGPSYTVALVGFAFADPIVGMFVMLIFGMGTIPALLIVGYGAGMLPIFLRQWAYRIAAVFMILVGIQLGLRGLAFYGVVDHLHIISGENHIMVW